MPLSALWTKAPSSSLPIPVLCQCQSELLETELQSFNGVISACSKAGKWQRAQAILPELEAKDKFSDLFTYSSVISATEEGSRWEQVQHLMCKLQDSSFQVNLIVCNAAISALARAARTSSAISLYQDMLKQRLTADAVTYEALLSALHQGARFHATLHLLQVVNAESAKQLQVFTTLHFSKKNAQVAQVMIDRCRM